MSDQTIIQVVTIICATLLNITGIIFVYRKQQQTHDLVNSSSAQLNTLTASSSRAEGKLEGIQQATDEALKAANTP